LRLILEKVSVASAQPAETFEPGQAAVVEPARLLLQTGKGLLSLDRVQPAGKKGMEIGEFLRGHKVQVGERFGDPE
jgi:methionyl-tRNA formyltransferase